MNRYVSLSVALLLFSFPAQAELKIPSCNKLNDFPISGISPALSRGDPKNIMSEFFGLPLSKWTDEDIASFGKIFKDCRAVDKSFFTQITDNYFNVLVVEAKNDIKKAIPDAVKVSSSRQGASSESSRLMKEVEEISMKIDLNSAAETDITRLKEIQTETGALIRKYGGVPDFFKILSDSGEAESKYKEKKNKEANKNMWLGENAGKTPKEIKAKEQAEYNSKVERRKRAESVVDNKYPAMKMEKNFLSEKLRIYDENKSNNYIDPAPSVIEFYDNLVGEKMLETASSPQKIIQNTPHPDTGKPCEIIYVFDPPRRLVEEYVKISNIYVDKRHYVGEKMLAFIRKMQKQ